MKKYYLIAEQNEGKFNVFVTDADKLGTVLMEIEAINYSEAVAKVSFSARNMGETAYCGIRADGKPYCGRA